MFRGRGTIGGGGTGTVSRELLEQVRKRSKEYFWSLGVFSDKNQRFAAAYVRPHQRATLTGKFLSSEQQTIRFRAWEATRNVQLRLCCDTTENCVFETELGIKRGTRRWLVYRATCPAGTKKVSLVPTSLHPWRDSFCNRTPLFRLSSSA